MAVVTMMTMFPKLAITCMEVNGDISRVVTMLVQEDSFGGKLAAVMFPGGWGHP